MFISPEISSIFPVPILYTPIRRAMAAKLSRALVQSNKLRKAYVMSGAVMIETNDGQKIKITDIKQITRYQ